MKLSKRTACFFSLILIIAYLLTACTGGSTDKQSGKPDMETQTVSVPISPSPITLDFFINYDWWPKSKEDWGNDLTSKEITRITGVALNINKPANSDESLTRLNMMLSTGDFPDIVMADDGVIMRKLIQKGMFMPLDEMIDKYGQEIVKNIGRDYLKDYCTEADGKIYGLPNGINFEGQAPESGSGLLVLKGLYERLGKPPLDTPEDVYNYLVKVRESGLKTKNGEGYIPSTFDWPTQDLSGFYGVRFFTIDGGSYVYGNDKKLRQVLRVPEMKEIFHFTSKLFREKLIDQEWLLQDEGSAVDKKMSGRIAIYFSANAFGWLDEYNDRLENKSGDTYMLVKAPLAPGLKDVKYNLVRKRPFSRIYITTKCKDPVRAMEFFNWEASENGQYISRIGPEGVAWSRGTDGKPTVTEEFAQKLSEVRDTALSEIGYYKWCFMQNNKFTENAVTALMTPVEISERKVIADIITKSMWYAPELERLTIDPASITGIANTRIKSYFGKTDRKLYMAQSDEEFEKLYNSALPEMEKLGLADVEDELNRQIADNLR